MKTRILTLFTIAALSVGIAHAQSVPKAVKVYVAKAAKDPQSVRFGEFTQVVNGEANMQHVCGFVNAKNSYGGYSGERMFEFTLASGQVILANDLSDLRVFGNDLQKCLQFSISGNMPKW